MENYLQELLQVKESQFLGNLHFDGQTQVGEYWKNVGLIYDQIAILFFKSVVKEVSSTNVSVAPSKETWFDAHVFCGLHVFLL